MATYCSICNDKMSSFGNITRLVDTDPSTLVCGACNEKVQLAKTEDIPDSAETIKRNQQEVIEYLGNAALSGSVSKVIGDYLMTIPNIHRYVTGDSNSRVLMTTGFSFEDMHIVRYLSVINADVIIGTGMFAETAARISDIAGSSSGVLEEKLMNARIEAMRKLENRVNILGGNAVIGISFNIYSYGNNMLGVSVNGTCVEVK